MFVCFCLYNIKTNSYAHEIRILSNFFRLPYNNFLKFIEFNFLVQKLLRSNFYQNRGFVIGNVLYCIYKRCMFDKVKVAKKIFSG